MGCGPAPRPHGGSEAAKRDRPSREEKQREKCIIKLMCIDAAKEQWALAEDKVTGDEIVKDEVDEYIRGGAPRCPAGGTYTYGKINEPPRCSVPGHILED